jgi:NAD(P)-dependent dehydrogenase (short-subunit alcohol dehydrogenase family)
MNELAGKAVIVTGSSRGIGAVCARAIAARGAAVVVNGTDAAAVAAMVAEIAAAGGRCAGHVGDISDWRQAEALVATCLDSFGAIDGLVNNAGISLLDLIDEIDPEEFRRVLDVNVLSTAYCASHALRAMRKQGRGTVINITSGSHAGVQAMSAYTASKGAIASLTYTWAMEFAGTGIRINAVAPRAQTGMSAETTRYRTAKGMGLLTPTPAAETNAPLVEFLLSDEAAGINGQVFRIDGRELALMTHPALHHPVLVRDEWTFDAVRQAFAADFSQRAMPLGVARLDAKVVR